jgi:hypothetical protein
MVLPVGVRRVREKLMREAGQCVEEGHGFSASWMRPSARQGGDGIWATKAGTLTHRAFARVGVVAFERGFIDL